MAHHLGERTDAVAARFRADLFAIDDDLASLTASLAVVDGRHRVDIGRVKQYV